MRVLLTTFGGRGDVEPLAGLTVQLRRLGAEVVACAPPDDDLHERLRGAGAFDVVAVGPSARELMNADPRPSIPDTAAIIIADQFATMLPVARGCDVAVVTGAMPAAAGGLSVCEAAGIRAVSVTFQQFTLPSPLRRPIAYPGRPHPPEVTDNAALWDLDRQTNNLLFGEALNRARAQHGLPTTDDVRGHVMTDEPWLATDPTLDPWDAAAAGYDVVQTGAWTVPDERPLPADLEAFLAAGGPPVYVGFGSMTFDDPARVAADVLAAVRAHRHRAVLMSGWGELGAIDDRDDVFVVGDVNHQALFPRMAAVVHHGGAGTTLAASKSGAPQVVVPQAADQPYWAARVAELGIGVAHDGPTPTAASLTEALDVVLTDGARDRARLVAADVRADGAERAAKLLVDGG
jgi:vancomycin aglycone glucosyltransferase